MEKNSGKILSKLWTCFKKLQSPDFVLTESPEFWGGGICPAPQHLEVQESLLMFLFFVASIQLSRHLWIHRDKRYNSCL